MHYFYPKPWEALRTGLRVDTGKTGDTSTMPSALPASQADETLQKADELFEELETSPEEVASPSDQPSLPGIGNREGPLQQLIEGDKIPQPTVAPESAN